MFSKKLMFSDIYFQIAYEIPVLGSALIETALELAQHFVSVRTSLAHCTYHETERFPFLLL